MNRWIALFSSLLFCLPPCVLAQGWRPDKAVEIVIGAAPGPPEPTHSLTYGLIWLGYLRRREPELTIDSLALFLPPGALTATALRLKHLTGARFLVFTYTDDGHCHPLDLADCGNLHTELQPGLPVVEPGVAPIHELFA